jgi:hypothetical protein
MKRDATQKTRAAILQIPHKLDTTSRVLPRDEADGHGLSQSFEHSCWSDFDEG